MQTLEIAIDTMDATADPSVLEGGARLRRRAELPRGAERDRRSGAAGPGVLVPALDEPRPQRNRIHFDITVPHDEADGRIAAALAAGGTLVSDAEARAFWILADAEGNEICVCTWQDRENRS